MSKTNQSYHVKKCMVCRYQIFSSDIFAISNKSWKSRSPCAETNRNFYINVIDINLFVNYKISEYINVKIV